jgi:O-antigen biosynthesis protein WbqP
MRESRFHRVFDTAVVLLAIPVVAPFCLALMILIRCESRGSPLFVQRRVGRGQRVFKLYKLRTMTSDTGDRPSHEVGAAQITWVGRILRRTKLDELPQLWNILRGEMTFVGPRPCLPSQKTLIEERAARGLFDILPGITGPAQVSGIDMATPVRMAEVEGAYFGRATLKDHVRIVILTLVGAGSGDAAGKI